MLKRITYRRFSSDEISVFAEHGQANDPAIAKAILVGAVLREDEEDEGWHRWYYNGDKGPWRSTRERAAVCFLLNHGLTIEP